MSDPDTVPFELVEDAVRDALTHLYDPDYRPPDLLCALTGCTHDSGAGPIQGAVVRTIRAMAPPAHGATHAYARRLHGLLHHRYILRLTQEETAERLNLSVRHLNRVQREAIHALARRLWEQAADGDRTPDSGLSPEGSGWQTQVRQELASLETASDPIESDLHAVLLAAMRIAGAADIARGVTLDSSAVSPGLSVPVHPSVLRQIILTVTSELARAMESGSISWRAERVGAHISTTATARPVSEAHSPDLTLARELVAAHHGEITGSRTQAEILVAIELPTTADATRRITVLAIDDNADLIALFQSYCTGTRFEIVHIREGRAALDAIERHTPDLILLDVMLPDADGWDLLLDLHALSHTRSIPVIVCSVVTDEHLALSLGAARYLRKPVWRQQLIEAFEQAISPAPSGALPAHRHTSPPARL